jgi:hypothetical protein
MTDYRGYFLQDKDDVIWWVWEVEVTKENGSIQLLKEYSRWSK